MILDMINYLQELKTMILENAGFPVIAFSIFEDVPAKTQDFENGKMKETKKCRIGKNRKWKVKKSQKSIKQL